MKSALRLGLRWVMLRRFLKAALLIPAVIGAATACASTCPPLADMNLPRLQGSVYGPSGVPVPQIQIQAELDGKVVGKAQTDDKGKFEIKVAPGNYIVHLQFMGSKSLDMNVRVGHGYNGIFHSPRMRIVLGLSGMKCSYATTSMKLLKNEIKRYQQRLVEVPSGP